MKRGVVVFLLIALWLVLVQVGCGRKADPLPRAQVPVSTERAE